MSPSVHHCAKCARFHPRPQGGVCCRVVLREVPPDSTRTVMLNCPSFHSKEPQP